MIIWRFSKYTPKEGEDPFERLLKTFQELLVHTSGDVSEALSWLTELDKHYELTSKDYGIADFIQDLIDKGYIGQPDGRKGSFDITSKMEIALRKKSARRYF